MGGFACGAKRGKGKRSWVGFLCGFFFSLSLFLFLFFPWFLEALHSGLGNDPRRVVEFKCVMKYQTRRPTAM